MHNINLINQQLQMILSSLPQSREKAMVNRWREEAAFFAKQRETRLKVLAAVRDGYDTLAEVTAQTRIPRSTCYKLLRRLVIEEALIKTRVICAGNYFEFRFELNIK